MNNEINPSTARAPAPSVAPPVARPAEVTTAVPTPAPKQVAETKPNAKEVRRSLEEASALLNKQMNDKNRDLSFSVDDVANKVVLTVKNSESGEVIRQIPNEVAIRVAHNMDNVKGLMQDTKS